MKKIITVFSVLLLVFFAATAQKKINILAGKKTAEISPQMWGIFFEDINFSADGGLLAELVKNTSFEFPMPLMGWKESNKNAGKILVINRQDENVANARFAHITANAGAEKYAMINEGFRGMGIQKGETYNFSVWVANAEAGMKLQIELLNSEGKVIGNSSLQNFSGDWKKYSTSFIANDSTMKGSLRIAFQGKGAMDIDRISLVPQHTWKERPNGLRKDLVEMLAGLKPGFLRFPGGCIVEGKELANRYQWKNTVGDLNDRKLLMNRWNVEFARRAAPDYFQTFGLGFFEYFQLSEDLGAEPLPIINCGMACQYNNAEVASMDELQPFVQDALDLVEFANGSVNTTWGKLRADMGHPQPFNMKLLGIGNEQWDEQYIERYKVFEKIIKERHPEIKLIAAAGPSPDGPRFDYAWKELRNSQADFMDEHYYQSPEWFLKSANRYDNYDRKGPKVFAGEFAAHGKELPQAESKNTWYSALTEAAFMTGLERNSDIVKMSSYAPLLAHVDAWQWRPDLIWFDNLRATATPNYYVQQLYANNKGTSVIPALYNGNIISGQDSLYASAVIDEQTGGIIVKLVNVSSKRVSVVLDINGKGTRNETTITELFSNELEAYNTLNNPGVVEPKQTTAKVKNKKITWELKPFSFTVFRL